MKTDQNLTLTLKKKKLSRRNLEKEEEEEKNLSDSNSQTNRFAYDDNPTKIFFAKLVLSLTRLSFFQSILARAGNEMAVCMEGGKHSANAMERRET